jgi:uncharacterized repeat protein (TIGR03803 family)
MRTLSLILSGSFSLIFLFLLPKDIDAQVVKLYGMTSSGGDSAGVIFSINSDGSNYQVVYPFTGGADGRGPDGTVTMGLDSKLYGLTTAGGSHDRGVLFAYDTVTHIYQKLFDFDTASGFNPAGDLTFFNNKFYGLGVMGGANGRGTIFSYSPADSSLTVEYDLTTAEGAQPFGNITVLKNKFYFTTNTGGANNGGVLNVFDPVTRTVTNLHDFPSGWGPWSSMAVLHDVLYGVVTFGGTNNLGSMYSYNPDSSLYRDIFDYNIPYNGIFPYGITPFHELLFVTTANGGRNQQGGTLGYLNPKTGGYSQFYAFNSQHNIDGVYPYSSPLILPNGVLLGTTIWGGTADSGVVYRYDLNANTYTKLVDLGGAKGGYPSTGKLFLPGGGVVLPLEVVQFTGRLTDAGRLLSWTATQIEPGGWFQLQRSTDSKMFAAIDSIDASTAGRYNYTDAAPLPGVGVVYYRLKLTHASQTASYTNIVAIGLQQENDHLRLVNTMVTGTAYLEYSATTTKGSMLMRVVNSSGQVMLQQNLVFSKGMNNYTLDMQALPKGMYLLQAAGKTIRFMKM